jgi:hypothetical protein
VSFLKNSPDLLVLHYGMGVDSTAVLVGFQSRGIRPDLILFADTGGEKKETYLYLTIINRWLRSVGFPEVTVVKYVVKNFKNWPPYYDLEENCLTNGTLPSEAFGFGSCSLKWKTQPQEKFLKTWQPAVDCWAAGGKIHHVIGYDDSSADKKRSCSAKNTFKAKPEDTKNTYWYPLQEWHWDRERCQQEIAAAGLVVPPKSSCFFCPNMRTAEVRALPKEKLARIVIMEARAKPRLQKIQGLWRNGRKGTRGGEKFPGMMTDFIREEGLLSGETIDRLAGEVPKELIERNAAHAAGQTVESWEQFMARVLREVA